MTIEERFAPGGRFAVEGVDLDAVLGLRGTPCYLYSAAVIRAKYALMKQHFPGFDTCYSLKANPNVEVARVLAAAGAGAEISSGGELRAALSAGFDPCNTLFVGPAKSTADIEAAVDSGIYALVADSAAELDTVEAVAAERGRRMRILLRINTLERPNSWEQMVGGPSKFGFDEETVVRDVGSTRLAAAYIGGIQVYSGSQSLDPGFISNHVEYVLRLAERLARRLKFKLECIDFGGGFGVPYNESDRELDLSVIAKVVAGLRLEHRAALKGCRLVFESGRYLVAESGVFLTRVARVKESRGRVFAITDGGMNGFARPAFMRLTHPVRLANRMTEAAAAEVDVCGPICTPLDCIGKASRLPKPVAGDVVGFFNAGAYGYTMSLLDFMSLGRPAEVLADNGELRVIREPVRPA